MQLSADDMHTNFREELQKAREGWKLFAGIELSIFGARKKADNKSVLKGGAEPPADPELHDHGGETTR